MGYIDELGKNAKIASQSLVKLGTAEKNRILNLVAKALLDETDFILQENVRDVEKAQENDISPVMLDRLRLDAKRIEGIVEGVRQVADFQDPIGQVVRGYTNLDGLKIVQKRVPLGVIAMIFESRPNVSVDAFSLAFKTSNAIILRGGRDAIHSNTALVTVIRKALAKAGLNKNVVHAEELVLFRLSKKNLKFQSLKLVLVIVIFLLTKQLIWRWRLRLSSMPKHNVQVCVMQLRVL